MKKKNLREKPHKQRHKQERRQKETEKAEQIAQNKTLEINPHMSVITVIISGLNYAVKKQSYRTIFKSLAIYYC